MERLTILKSFFLTMLLALLVTTPVMRGGLPGGSVEASPLKAVQQAAAIPYFRQPVVPGATISGYFDHNPAAGMVTFYDGRSNAPGAGFYFSCSNPSMWDWVGCTDNVSGEGACANDHELWYDDHHGTDYEYSSNWYTGATCDPGRFAGITHPVYAPARGKVLMAGYDANRPANGWHIRLKHDLNGNGNFDDDNLRSVYLHFTANALAVSPGQIVDEGQYLGLGGSTGYSSSPHLHFEVQRSSDYFQTTYWPVDPYGWQGVGTDPWGYSNVSLWRIQYTNRTYIPLAMYAKDECTDCGDMQLIQNGGFESGRTNWVEQGLDTIVNTSYAYLKINPYRGNWLAWLGGRNNAIDRIYEDIQLPTGHPRAAISYYLRMDTFETGGIYDVMYVNLRDANDNLIQQLDYIDNTFSAPAQWVKRSIALPDLSAWEGSTVRLSFEARTDGNTISSFYIDEVEWTASAP